MIVFVYLAQFENILNKSHKSIIAYVKGLYICSEQNTNYLMSLQRLPIEAEVLPVLALNYQLESLKTIEKFWLRGKRAKILPPKPYNITAVKFYVSSKVCVYREFEGTETVEDGIVILLGDRLLPPLNSVGNGRPVKYDFERMEVGEHRLIKPGRVKRPAIAYAAIQSFQHRTGSEIELVVVRDSEGLKVARTA